MNNNKNENRKAKIVDAYLKVDDITLITLKGHLVIEEHLSDIISKFVHHSSEAENAKLSFHQKVFIARSMSLKENNNEVWDLILAINSLRNDLAHSLESNKRENKLLVIKNLYLKQFPNNNKEEEWPDDNLGLARACSFCTGFLQGLEAEIDILKDLFEPLKQFYLSKSIKEA